MDERIYLMRNDKLFIGTETWLVLKNMNEYVLIIKLNTDKLLIEKVKTEDIVYKIIRKDIVIDLSHSEECLDVDIESKSPNQQAKYQQSKKVIEFILSTHPDPEWLYYCEERAVMINGIVKKFSISPNSARRIIRKYFQGGMNLKVLVPQYHNCGKSDKRMFQNKKPGHRGISTVTRDERMEEIFKIMTNRYLKSGAKIQIARLYEDMVEEFFSERKIVGAEVIYNQYPASLRPTVKQLRYWINTQVNDLDIEIRRNGKKYSRNNLRATFSDSIAYLDVKTIGSRYEMDEVETDFYLVNRIDRNVSIGRAIVYFIVDVFSRAIVGCSVGLDNNSWSGAEIALLNLVEDKKEFSSRYEIDIDENEWPMKQVIPSCILVDNGAEYLSENFLEMARDVGLSIDFAPPGMGSYKANVEQKFKQMNNLLKNNIPGEIEKGKYGQPHIRSAQLDIYQFSKIVIHFIINYNNNAMDTYPDSKDLFESRITLTPTNIWNYSFDKYNELIYVNDIESYKYSLMKRDKAILTRSGIEYKGRYYICEDLKWIANEAAKSGIKGHKKKYLNIRFDTRCPDIIYYEHNMHRYRAFLNNTKTLDKLNLELPLGEKTSNSKFVDLTEPEIEDLLQFKKQQKLDNAELRLHNNINTRSKINNIKKSASQMHHGSNQKKGIDKSREQEKQALHSEQNINLNYENSTNVIQENKKQYVNNEKFLLSDIDTTKMTRIDKIRWKEQQRISKMRNSNNEE